MNSTRADFRGPSAQMLQRVGPDEDHNNADDKNNIRMIVELK